MQKLLFKQRITSDFVCQANKNENWIQKKQIFCYLRDLLVFIDMQA